MAFSFQKFTVLAGLIGKAELTAEDIAKVNNELKAQGISAVLISEANATKAAGYDALKQQLEAAIADNNTLKANDKTQALADLQTKYEAAQAEIKTLGGKPAASHSNPVKQGAEDDGTKPEAEEKPYLSKNFVLNQLAEEFHKRK